MLSGAQPESLESAVSNLTDDAASYFRLLDKLPDPGLYRVAEYSDEARQEFICSICSGLDLNVVDAGCGYGHCYCKTCILEWITLNSVCPFCQQPISCSTLCRMPSARYAALLKTRVTCCCHRWNGPFSKLPHHMLNCPESKVNTNTLRLNGNRGTEPNRTDLKEALDNIKAYVSCMMDILKETHPKEYCIKFGEPLPLLLSFGGSNASCGNIVEEYNYEKDTWVKIVNLPFHGETFTKFSLGMFTTKMGGNIIIAGGLVGIGKGKSEGHAASRNAERIKIHTPFGSIAWNPLRLPGAKPEGTTQDKSYTIPRNDVFEFSLSNKKFTQLPSLSLPREDPVTIAVQDRVFVLGGKAGESPVSSFEVLVRGEHCWRLYSFPPFVKNLIDGIEFNGLIFLVYSPCTLDNNVNEDTGEGYDGCLPTVVRTKSERRSLTGSMPNALDSSTNKADSRYTDITGRLVPKTMCCIMDPSKELALPFRSSNCWKMVDVDYCDSILRIAAYQDRLYLLCEFVNNIGARKSVQLYNPSKNEFRYCDHVTTAVVLNYFELSKKCILPLDKKYRWISKIADTRENAICAFP